MYFTTKLNPVSTMSSIHNKPVIAFVMAGLFLFNRTAGGSCRQYLQKIRIKFINIAIRC